MTFPRNKHVLELDCYAPDISPLSAITIITQNQSRMEREV